MKRIFLILGVLFLCGAFVLSCASTSTKDTKVSANTTDKPGHTWPSDLGSFTAKATTSDGNNLAIIIKPELTGGNRIRAGETYTLKTTFTVSRDLGNFLWVCLVDRTEAGGWWTELCDIDTSIVNVKKDVPVSTTLTFKIKASASGGSASANSIIMMCYDEPVKGLGPFNIDFTEFVFNKVQ